MNCVNFLGNVFKKSAGPFLGVTNTVLSQQTRNTFILKRRNAPPLYRKGSKPKELRHRHFIYDLVEDKNVRKRPAINLILTQYVESLGDRGDKITMSAFKAYDELLLPGLAVYDTPENAAKLCNEENRVEKKFSSRYAERTMSILSQYVLNITMNNDNPWTLEKWHVRAAFRKASVNLNDDCITMPPHEITGPNHDIENREFYVTVTINKTEKTHVRCRIHHHTADLRKKKAIPVTIDFWKKMAQPIFPEDKAVLDKLPIPYVINREMQKEVMDPDMMDPDENL